MIGFDNDQFYNCKNWFFFFFFIFAWFVASGSGAASGDGAKQEEYEEERELVDILSTIQPPVVSNLQARSAIVAWSPPAALSELLAYVASRRSENQTSATDVAVGDKDKEEGEDGVKDGESKSPKGKKNSGRKRKDGGDKEDGGDNEEEEVKKEPTTGISGASTLGLPVIATSPTSGPPPSTTSGELARTGLESAWASCGNRVPERTKFVIDLNLNSFSAVQWNFLRELRSYN